MVKNKTHDLEKKFKILIIIIFTIFIFFVGFFFGIWGFIEFVGNYLNLNG